MNIRVKNTRGKIVKTVSLSDDVFGSPMNQALVHQVVVGQLANARQGTAHTKTRAQVAGGGANLGPRKALVAPESVQSVRLCGEVEE